MGIYVSNQKMTQVLESLGDRLGLDDDIVYASLLWPEERDRYEHNTVIGAELRRRSPRVEVLGPPLKRCWALGERFVQLRVSSFLRDEPSATALIRALVRGFPGNDDEASRRIDAFVAGAVDAAFHATTGAPEAAAAALFASVLLSSRFPRRFVDYRKNRWERLASALGADIPPESTTSHGTRMVFSANLARAIAETAVFKARWPNSEELWAVASLCWAVEYARTDKNRDKFLTENDSDALASFPEGRRVRRMHWLHERNAVVVKKAKVRWKKRDPLLRCAVCDFSFSEAYGPTGEGFIEAHHRVPLGELSGRRETRVADLAPVCGNCHRMLHYGAQSRTVDQLKALLENRRQDA